MVIPRPHPYVCDRVLETLYISLLDFTASAGTGIKAADARLIPSMPDSLKKDLRSIPHSWQGK